MSELLPCPHCAGEPEFKQIGSDTHGPLWSVHCWKCVHVSQKIPAMASWNRRIEPAATCYRPGFEQATEALNDIADALALPTGNTTADVVAAVRSRVAWIACSERMPEEGQEVLACWSAQPRGCGVVIWQHGQWLDPDSDDHSYSAPKHWMPLPAGPKP